MKKLLIGSAMLLLLAGPALAGGNFNGNGNGNGNVGSYNGNFNGNHNIRLVQR